MLLLSLPLLLLASYHTANAGSVSKGGACNVANSRLQTGTYQFYSDCDSVTYCASNSTCLLKGCRKDVFPFGYPQDSNSLPPLCQPGNFCPDEGDACQPLLAVNSPCQLNRDGMSLLLLLLFFLPKHSRTLRPMRPAPQFRRACR